MRTTAQRVSALHIRMAARRRGLGRRAELSLGALCAGLSLCLVQTIFGRGAHAGGAATLYGGSTLLFENVGGYVLAAVLAFTAGVVVTALCLRRQRRTAPMKEAQIELAKRR